MAKAERSTGEAPVHFWSKQAVLEFAPDEASIPAAEKVLKKGGFGKVEATADGKGWWVVCRGLTGTYQTSVRVEDGVRSADCTCPSPKYPCKHALALLLYLLDHPEERAEPEAPQHAATDFEALLRAVFQNPEDDTARLVFADFLEENDQPDRAALIRLQVERGRHKSRSDEAKALAKQEKALTARVRAASVDPLPQGVRAESRRGFLHLSLLLHSLPDIGSLPERFTRLFRDGWVETVRVVGYFFEPLTEEHATLLGLVGELDLSDSPMTEDALVAVVTQAAEMRSGGRLARVKVHRTNQRAFDRLGTAQAGGTVSEAGRVTDERRFTGLTRQSLDLLIRAGRLRTARQLVLDGALGDVAAAELASADLSAVEGLFLSRWQLGPGGVAAVANAPGLTAIEAFGMSDTRLGPAHAAALANGAALALVRRMLLMNAGLTDDALAALGGGQPFPGLRYLDVENNAFTAAGLLALLTSPNFPALAAVGVTGNDLDYPELLPLLLSAPDRPELTIGFRGLQLDRRVTPDGVRLNIIIPTQLRADLFGRLTRDGGARRVTTVRVARAEMTPAGLRALAKSLDPAALKEVEFQDVTLRNEGVEVFLAAFRGFRLHRLALPTCRVQASGVAALAASPLLDPVKVLDLSGNAIGKGGAEALARSKHLGNLERLVLTDWRVGGAEQKLLKAKFGRRLEL